MRPDTPPQPIRLSDYRPPDYLVDHVDLDVALDPERTVVSSRLVMRRSKTAAEDAPLVLNGEAIELLALAVDGDALKPSRYSLDDKTLTVSGLPAAFTLEAKTACAPAKNTALSGLYLSSGMFCTQCEAEGFRRIAYFPDRPDVLARYSVRLEAEKARYPVLLANGNLTGKGALPNGRHYAQWADPHPKPCYLFALVGGDLACVEDSFVTMSGRKVSLRIYVQPKNRDKCAYTMDALKRAMKWDEEVFGREYDLDVFMIVAVDHFNFGAMENKGLNIFNSAYVLASPETASDADYEAIESIVAHEYFHNWSGNRVTCRDWFQLCLKEGFTVFRDQEFSADMRSAPVQRIKEVRKLWARQLPEDLGPLAHPPRPESYITIDNFYTATVYDKGAELVRMLKTLLGPAKFRKACDLYFSRHDGQAATVEDFVKAMEQGGGVDLTQFRRWYSDAGTPRVRAEERFNKASGAFELTLTQTTAPTPGQADKPPRHFPLAFSLYGARLGDLLESGVVEMKEERQSLRFGPYKERPVASLFQNYSAPVILEGERSLDERLLLAANDADLFNRWASVEGLWVDLCLAFAGARDMQDKERALDRFAQALGDSLNGEDRALTAELLRCPSEADLANRVSVIDPHAIAAARKTIRGRVGSRLKEELRRTYLSLRSNAPYEPTAAQAGERALKNSALSLLVAAGEDGLAVDQSKTASNMTDEAAATAALAMSDSPAREDALARFYERWKRESNVVDKWLAWRALAPAAVALDDVRALLSHEAFDRKNPNKVRALIGVFARENLAGFHRADGAAYAFFADEVLALDRLNPQLAARLMTTVESWKNLEPGRRAQLEATLRRIAETKGISANLYEMATRLLGGST
jgi:aminopeptidase N